MDNKCPKCNGKLKVFYLKQECPHCGCDLVNYDLERRLEEDAVKAEAEFAAVNDIILKIKSKFSFIFNRNSKK